MYIMETGLPTEWGIIWAIISIIIILNSIRKTEATYKEENVVGLTVILSFFIMVILTVLGLKYANPLISGNGLAAITSTYVLSSQVGVLAIIFIKIFTGVGGFTSIGANVFAIAIAGPYVGYRFYKYMMDNYPKYYIIAVSVGVFLTEIVSILVSCFQLAIVYQYPTITGSFIYHVNMYLIKHFPEIALMIVFEILLTFLLLKIAPKLKKEIKFDKI